MPNAFRILVAIDLQSGTARLLAEVQRYATALGAVVDILHVADPDPNFVGYIKGHSPRETFELDSRREPKARELRMDHRETQALAALLREGGVQVDQALTVQGAILDTILEHARRDAVDLLILGSHHHGPLHRMWFGDTAAEAARQAPCAVLIVPLPAEE